MANRVAYENDGSVAAWWQDVAGFSVLTPANAKLMNGVASANFPLNGSTGKWYASVAFPETRDLQGYFASAVLESGTFDGSVGIVETSVNTTTGIDGVWVSHGAVSNPNGILGNITSWPNFTVLTVPGIRGIRISYNAAGPASYNGSFQLFHVYATQSTPTGRLALWHATLDQALDSDDIAWGVAPRASTAIQQFRVKNTHATDTAQDIILSSAITNDASPSLLPQLEFSTDGITFSAMPNIGNLVPGALSGVLHYRRSILANAQLGYWMPQLIASATTWV